MTFENIPEEIRGLRQWVEWKPVTRGEKLTKVPVTRQGALASSTDPKSWCSFDELTGARRGFVFTANDPYCGIDLDHCRDSRSGRMTDDALDLITTLQTYTEISVSGTGAHCICKATLGKGRRFGGLEIYDRGRYFCMTGHVVAFGRVESRQDAIERLVQEKDEAKGTRAGEENSAPRVSFETPPDDVALLVALKQSTSFVEFDQVGGLISRPPDYSRLLFHCAYIITRYTSEVDQVERVMRATALYRDSERARRKWDTPRNGTTWGRQLIMDAIGGGERY